MRVHVLCAAVLLLAVATDATVCSAAPSLSEAYDKEIAVLNSEKAVLESALLKLAQERESLLSPLRAEIKQLSESLSRIRIENEKREDRIGKAEEHLRAVSSDTSVTDTLTAQIRRTYQGVGLLFPDSIVAPEEEVPGWFSEILARVKTMGSIRVETGAYFDAEGNMRTGEIFRLSKVSASSMDKEHGGPLAYVGPDTYRQILVQPDKTLARYWETNEETLAKVVLFDPVDKGGAAAAMDKTLIETFLSGGIVMWPILLLGILSLLILIERLISLNRVHTNADRLMRRVGELISRVSWEGAKDVCVRNAGAVAQVLETIIRHRDRPRDQQEELVYESILSQKPKLDRFLSMLNIIAAAAPLLGLLGTVTGMIGTFEVITTHGTGDPKILSGGISEALLTTELGLIVAIPALFFHAILSSRVDHIMGDMETNGVRLLNLIHCPSPDTVEGATEEKRVAG